MLLLSGRDWLNLFFAPAPNDYHDSLDVMCNDQGMELLYPQEYTTTAKQCESRRKVSLGRNSRLMKHKLTMYTLLVFQHTYSPSPPPPPPLFFFFFFWFCFVEDGVEIYSISVSSQATRKLEKEEGGGGSFIIISYPLSLPYWLCRIPFEVGEWGCACGIESRWGWFWGVGGGLERGWGGGE